MREPEQLVPITLPGKNTLVYLQYSIALKIQTLVRYRGHQPHHYH